MTNDLPMVRIVDEVQRERFKNCLPVDAVPVREGAPKTLRLGDHGFKACWMVDLQRLTPGELAVTAQLLADEKGAELGEVLEQFSRRGFPLRCEVCEVVRRPMEEKSNEPC